MSRELAATLVLFSLAHAPPVSAQEQEQAPQRDLPRLGQAPGEAQVRSAPPSVTMGTPSETRESVLDFHGYLLLPLRVGIHQRQDPGPGQGGTVLRTPALIPQYRRSFEYVGVVPDPWVQLNFTYGNRVVSGTAIISAETVNDGAPFYDPVKQLGVNDAFISVNLEEPFKTPVELKVGAMTGRYGAMGMYDSGRYATPLIARTNAVGESVSAGFDLGSVSLVVEQGLGGQIARPPRGMVPAGWNGFADPNVGATFVHHEHIGLGFGDLVQVGGHYLMAWSQDDQTPTGLAPDGSITILGGDARLTAGRAGHLYLGGTYTKATNVATLSGVIEVLNARGGPELIDEYLGPDSGGDGALVTVGGQYDLSVARAVYGDRFFGKSPDLIVSVFGMGTSVTSDDADYDGVQKLKLGSELTYNMFSWFGVSGRFDHVAPDMENTRRSFNIISPRLLFHTGWQSRDEFALQYSHFMNGSEVYVRTGSPSVVDEEAQPDKHVFTLSGTFWW